MRACVRACVCVKINKAPLVFVVEKVPLVPLFCSFSREGGIAVFLMIFETLNIHDMKSNFFTN